ncbi:transposase [candidate division CSSED10-310 bacterium]|uniref:Transposase n=1 Tax=candidate division CSSED10-310 bacterium TaxID=2855610 RepID=A0ABV6YZ16_UNCC1
MSYTQIYYHIIYSTKGRSPTLNKDRRKELYNYIWGILKNKTCHLYQIGGMEDHIHLLTSLHSTVCLANLIRDMKTSSNGWIKKENIFQNFSGWQVEYGAFTRSHSHRDGTISYIKNQEEHHKRESFIDEFKRLLKEEGISFDERYLK